MSEKLISLESVLKEIRRFKGYIDDDMIERFSIAFKRLAPVEQPMSAVEFVRQFHRMCQSINCDECGLLHDDKVPRSCVCLLGVYPEFAVETIEKWAREHPEERSEE